MNIGIIIAAVLISLAIGAIIGIAYRKKVAESKIHSAEEEAKKIVNMAKVEAENLKKTKIIEAKEEIVNSRNELDQEIKERRGEVQRQETRLIQKEENLENLILLPSLDISKLVDFNPNSVLASTPEIS